MTARAPGRMRGDQERGTLVEIADRCVVEVFTAKRFRRPENPRGCSSKGYYHVFRWRGGPKAPKGTRCQCGLLEDPRPHTRE